MKVKSLINIICISGTIILSSCSSDDDAPIVQVEAPATYEFLRDGESTVSFSGQTTRIAMAEVIISEFTDNTSTEAIIDAMFDHQENVDDFEDADLNSSDKSVRSKTAASADYFSANATDAAAIKADFDAWIKGQVDEVFPNWAVTATAGNSGVLQEAGGGSDRYVNAKGLEYNQAFAKSLIGALMTDQALNNYLGTAVLDEADNVANNNDGVVADGKPYTTMEHKWDEAYGYLYGASVNPANPNPTIGDDDSFLNKYIGRVEGDADFAGIADDIYDAFKLGRAAIVAKNYTIRDQQAAIIREKISEIIAIRAVYYLQQGKNSLEETTIDYASAFHDLSEGYGFIYSLQFTRRSGSNAPYFTRTEVQAFIDQLMGGTNGLWDVTPAKLQSISETIADKFSFTVTEAGSVTPN
ncbi:DUF4856 domain-containing protein [Aquimarina sp. BL5]|uniref:DUF4856 domain-containing protein n=1 Tax=Aquimarina sp. BL5 TaxID=1714860 RepID=UPI000E5204F1|nr:DUF4856 domain-containing protein [Aquimarina sp. BL5]AXT50771.1 DUF4856 domain-containing protein [Aquimarina sp. BL5]RKN04459.1 DUF4856 domain-containing protein [Aquimarina sp. BL5]